MIQKLPHILYTDIGLRTQNEIDWIRHFKKKNLNPDKQPREQMNTFNLNPIRTWGQGGGGG